MKNYTWSAKPTAQFITVTNDEEVSFITRFQINKEMEALQVVFLDFFSQDLSQSHHFVPYEN